MESASSPARAIPAGARIWQVDETMHVCDAADLAALRPSELRFALHGGYLHKPSGRFLWYTDGMQFMNHRADARRQRRARHLAAAHRGPLRRAARHRGRARNCSRTIPSGPTAGSAPSHWLRPSLSRALPGALRLPAASSRRFAWRRNRYRRPPRWRCDRRDQLLEDDRLREHRREARLAAGAADVLPPAFAVTATIAGRRRRRTSGGSPRRRRSRRGRASAGPSGPAAGGAARFISTPSRPLLRDERSVAAPCAAWRG